MSAPNYLIDTNVFIDLEDAAQVPREFAELVALAQRHGVGVFVHEAAVDDIQRDKNQARRDVSLSKLKKFNTIKKVMDLTPADLAAEFGLLAKHNDVVDATLLHALRLGVASFLITEDRGLHERAQRHAPDLANRVMYVADALALLKTTYEPTTVSIPFIEEVDAHTIPKSDPIFATLRADYPQFDKWWEKCIAAMRKCWIVKDGGKVAGLVVRKEEATGDTDATLPGKKILKLCTFKVRPENRGIKLGELLLKQALWFAQTNKYDVVYLTTFPTQGTLIELIEYYGFQKTGINAAGEHIYEKPLSRAPLEKPTASTNFFDAARLAYPRFYAGSEVCGYGVPIKELYHEDLFPELARREQLDLFQGVGGPKTPGNNIRKVYLCRAQSNISQPGALLFFYKSASKNPPSQAITTLGLFESMALARSTEDLRQLAGGRSVYSEEQLHGFGATAGRPVKVINFLLVTHIAPVIELEVLQRIGVIGKPPQSIYSLTHEKIATLLDQILTLGFKVKQ
jgi:ribosomal protein S18 acetylase RimI-like enzyme